jgi:uncharacterized SAM-binding protein YcdF (DUF218 family)
MRPMIRGSARRRSGILTDCILIILCVSLVAGAFRWQATLTYLGSFLVDSQPPQRGDLILVLGGDFWGPRVVTGAELARQRYAPVVLLSSPPYQGRPQGELSIEFLVKKGYPKEIFHVFANDAGSTIAEAEILRGELARRHVKRVLLVTSSYHTRRATIVMNLFCPGVRFIPVSSPDPHYHVAEWWNDESSRHLFFSEWSKIVGSVALGLPAYVVSQFL